MFLKYESVYKNFPDWPPGARMQMVQLSATRCSCIAILWVSLASFAAITLYVASQRVFIFVSVYFVMTQFGNFWIHPRMWLYEWMTDWLTHSPTDLWPTDCHRYTVSLQLFKETVCRCTWEPINRLNLCSQFPQIRPSGLLRWIPRHRPVAQGNAGAPPVTRSRFEPETSVFRRPRLRGL
jgi:hypothetical protein